MEKRTELTPRFQEMVAIDESDLRGGWLEQASRYLEAATLEAEAARLVSEAKEALELAEAEEGAAIRDQAAKLSEKLTEKALTEKLVTNTRLVNLRALLRTAQFNYDVAVGARRAMDNRKAALENLVQLMLRCQSADPSTQGASRSDISKALLDKHQAEHPIRPPRRRG